MALRDYKEQRFGPRNDSEHEALREKREVQGHRPGPEGLSHVDIRGADVPMAEIWNDERRRAAFRDLAFSLSGDSFTPIMAKMQEGTPLTDNERLIREEARSMYVQREAVRKNCEDMLSADILAGIPAGHPLQDVIGSIGKERALELIKPMLDRLVSERDGARLNDLHRSLRSMRGLYGTRNYQKVSERVSRVREKYNLTPEEYTQLSRGGSLFQTASRFKQALSEDLGVVRRTISFVPNWFRGAQFGFAAWREGRSGALAQLNSQRGRVLQTLAHTLDADFYASVDREVTSGRRAEETQQERLRQHQSVAAELTQDAEQRRHDEAWAQVRAGQWERPSGELVTFDELDETDREHVYDRWRENEYLPGRERDITSRGFFSLLARFFASMLRYRAQQIRRPNLRA